MYEAMLSTERLDVSYTIEILNSKLATEFEQININRLNCFLLPSGVIINLFSSKDWKAVGVQYADNLKEAKKNLFEDGDLFYLEDMTEEELYLALLKEIKENC